MAGRGDRLDLGVVDQAADELLAEVEQDGAGVLAAALLAHAVDGLAPLDVPELETNGGALRGLGHDTADHEVELVTLGAAEGDDVLPGPGFARDGGTDAAHDCVPG